MAQPPAARILNLGSLDAEAASAAARIPGDGTIVAGDPGCAAAVAAHALDLRRTGQRFALSMHVEDVRVGLLREHSRELCATYATWDEVRLMLDTYAATLAGRAPSMAPDDRALLVEAIGLADALIVRSWGERERLIEAVGSVRRDFEVVVNEVPAILVAADCERTDVVVYAPLCSADELAPFVTALSDLELPVTIVARPNPVIPGRIRFEPPERAAAALGRARVIVDGTANDPGVALALAKLGRPLVVSSVSGAAEILRGVATYDLWNRRSILQAVGDGLCSAPPEIREERHATRPRLRAQPAFGAEAPLVSVVVATYNRPDLLATTLASIERQTYPALEVIVVNDGGIDVRNVVAAFPRVRFVDQPENGGPAAARNRGLADARGTFVTFFDDDDEMFPDHIALLASGLLRSGLDVAYGQMINCFVDRAVDGTYAITALAGHTAVLDHADIQWAGSLAPTALMFRRSLVAQIGLLDESLSNAEDYEFWLRLAENREWARVPEVTSIYFIRSDGTHYSSVDGVRRYLGAHQAIYAKHPSLRPLVRAGRAAMLEYFGGEAPARSGGVGRPSNGARASFGASGMALRRDGTSGRI